MDDPDLNGDRQLPTAAHFSPPPPLLRYLPRTPSSIYEVPREPRLRLLVAANGPRETAYAQAVAVRLSRDSNISIRVLVDDMTHRITQEFPAYANVGLQAAAAASSRDAETARRAAFDLVAWADLLVLAPLDADNMAKMMAGVADTLLLEVLRGWDASKRILLVPGMSTHMWENPMTKRQISKLHRKWPWIRVLPPILWHYEEATAASVAAASLSRPAPALSTSATATTAAAAFPSALPLKRIVEWTSFNDLIGMVRNHADLQTLGQDYVVSWAFGGLGGSGFGSGSGLGGGPSGSGNGCGNGGGNGSGDGSAAAQTPVKARLPPELWTMILEHTGDWELAQALGVFTQLPMPTGAGWRQQPRDPDDPHQVYMHELEWTLLTANTPLICQKLSEAPSPAPAPAASKAASATLAARHPTPTALPASSSHIQYLSALATKLIFKFSLTDVLTYMEAKCPEVFRSFDGKTLPTKASAYFGSTAVLDWWMRSPSFLEKQYDAEALDGASKNGFVPVLEWWRRSGLPLKYTEAALEQASARGHVHVLDWWREAALSSARPDLMLRPGRSLIFAAQHGRTAVIRWWDESGLNAGHEDNVCKVASRWGRVEVLELWRQLRGDDKLVFNQQVLVEPTMYSHLPVLEWWKSYAHGTLPGMNDRRAKQVEYRTMDIEEALEDALGDQSAVRRWWAENGLNLGLGTSEWMKSRYL